ncbi:glycoside hydrolase family 2 protein [uncultured Alistipes sp.]|uniref:glycoside hydrolase family 2 protein n=1 Tax=uncultured Alistipes sp. TaxID=538949 RepID=UPI00272A532C|nr:glycoside hydrolase family 2 TIM barrel-domain containing protein [uncultured Alistipes sp.]
MKRYLVLCLLLALATPLRAREIHPLNEGWRFFFRSETSSDNARYVTLPHSWNNDPTLEGVLIETSGNYQNDLYIPAEWASKRVFIRFYGAQNVADLFVNGYFAGCHRGGATAFTFEITDRLHFGADNILLMRVSNAARNDVLPTSADMNFYGGLYREAELIVTERTAVSPLYLGTEGVLVHQRSATKAKAEGEIEVHLTSLTDGSCPLTLTIAAPDGRTVLTKNLHVKVDSKPVRIAYNIASPELWRPGRPALYTVTVKVGEDPHSDRVSVRTGFREIKPLPSALLLNGDSMKLRGVTLYHDNAVSAGTLTAADYRTDLHEIRTLGANALRSAVMPHAQTLYDLCDEQGMLVWIDTPLRQAPFLSDAGYFATPTFEQNGLEQLREIVAQNLNHPSVVMWGIFSRMRTTGDDVAPYIRQLHRAARELDPSRPTVAVSERNGGINFITDLIVWRKEEGWNKGRPDNLTVWLDKLHKEWSHLRSAIEYGGEGFLDHRNYTAQPRHAAGRMPEERQARFHEEYARLLEHDSLLWGIWLENMFDYGSARRRYGINGCGLVTLDRRSRKDAFYLYKALWNKQEPTLHIADKRATPRTDSRQCFRVYSSAGEPVLTIGRDTVAMKRYARCQYRSDTVSLSGRVKVKVKAGALSDSVTLQINCASKPKGYPAPRRTTGR